ncbi:MAG: TIGR03643 family protein [Cytophagaceae bacterium]
MKPWSKLSNEDIDRIIEMAWEDRTPFDAIARQFELNEQTVVQLMRFYMKRSSFEMWRVRMKEKKTKHEFKLLEKTTRFKCSRQKQISLNKISKR